MSFTPFVYVYFRHKNPVTCIVIHLLMDFWAIVYVQLLLKKLLWTFRYKSGVDVHFYFSWINILAKMAGCIFDCIRNGCYSLQKDYLIAVCVFCLYKRNILIPTTSDSCQNKENKGPKSLKDKTSHSWWQRFGGRVPTGGLPALVTMSWELGRTREIRLNPSHPALCNLSHSLDDALRLS